MSDSINTTVAGIPCIVQPDRVFVQKPLGPKASNDYDCYGYSEVEFTVCDRNGRPAPWLAKKLTEQDTARITSELIDAAMHEDKRTNGYSRRVFASAMRLQIARQGATHHD